MGERKNDDAKLAVWERERKKGQGKEREERRGSRETSY